MMLPMSSISHPTAERGSMGEIEFTESYHMGRAHIPEWALVRMKDIVYDNGRVIEATVQTVNGEVRMYKKDVLLKTPKAVIVLRYKDAVKYNVV